MLFKFNKIGKVHFCCSCCKFSLMINPSFFLIHIETEVKHLYVLFILIECTCVDLGMDIEIISMQYLISYSFRIYRFGNQNLNCYWRLSNIFTTFLWTQMRFVANTIGTSQWMTRSQVSAIFFSIQTTVDFTTILYVA